MIGKLWCLSIKGFISTPCLSTSGQFGDVGRSAALLAPLPWIVSASSDANVATATLHLPLNVQSILLLHRLPTNSNGRLGKDPCWPVSTRNETKTTPPATRNSSTSPRRVNSAHPTIVVKTLEYLLAECNSTAMLTAKRG